MKYLRSVLLQVPFGILTKNENLTDEMLPTEDIQQKYVPVDHHDDKMVYQQTAVAGAATARKAQTV